MLRLNCFGKKNNAYLWMNTKEGVITINPNRPYNYITAVNFYSQNTKRTCISSSSRSNPPRSTHIMTYIPAPPFIISKFQLCSKTCYRSSWSTFIFIEWRIWATSQMAYSWHKFYCTVHVFQSIGMTKAAFRLCKESHCTLRGQKPSHLNPL